VLADLAGRTIVEHVLARVAAARSIDAVVLATTDLPEDDQLARLGAAAGVEVHRGSADDVLDRFAGAARSAHAGIVVRVTGDCPFIDPSIVDLVVGRHLESGADYTSNTLHDSFPDGMDVEVFTVSALERAWAQAHAPHEREHVTPYLKLAEGLVRVSVVSDFPEWVSRLRLTVDEDRDLEFARALAAELPDEGWGLRKIIAVLERKPELMAINQDILRNEGYYRSLVDAPPVEPQTRSLSRSTSLLRRAEAVVPSCTQTFSKGPTQFAQGVAPTFVERAKGSRVWDVDGNEYIDYSMALGAVILGHADERVDDAVRAQLDGGTVYSLPHPLEVEVSERLVELIPCADMVRFGKNGSDATTGAVRAARAFTGRDHIATNGYHGWHDWFIGTTTRSAGVPAAVAALSHTFAYNDIDSLRRIFRDRPGEIAAVILEPMGVVEPEDGFLEELAELTRREGALLIFDEVITGFRLAAAGGQERFGVVPDLGCFGKALGNGFPISVVVGRGDVMRLFDEIFYSFTFGGEVLALRAASAVLDAFAAQDVPAAIADRGARVRDGYNALAAHFGLKERTSCIGHGSRTVINFGDGSGGVSLELKTLFQQEVIKRGVLCGGYHNPSLAHSDADVDLTLRVYRDALTVMARAVEEDAVSSYLEARPVDPVFRAF
jgi:glutamate-1-semialdehyde 2,1-aminomutase/spore coat polysaccharide biosynthesis protein SpsF